jgi:hypothetical protein
MPRAKKLIPAPAASPDTSDLTAAADEQDVWSFFSDMGLGGEYNVQIQRRIESGDHKGKLAYLARRPYLPTLLDDLMREYGGGYYRIQLIDGDNKFVTGGSRTLVIDGVPIVPGAAAAAAVPAVAVVDQRLDGMQRLFETLLTALVAKPAAPVSSPLDDLVKLTTVLSGLNPPEKAQDGKFMDWYLRGRDEGERQATALAAVSQSGGADPDADALLKIGMPLVELAKQQMDINRQQPQVMVPAQRMAGAPAGPVNEVVDMPWWVVALRPYVRDLYDRARAGKNARVYADMVVEDMPDAALTRVADLVSDPDFRRQFLAVFPQFNETIELQQWVAEFLEGVREGVVEDDGSIDESPAGEVVNG